MISTEQRFKQNNIGSWHAPTQQELPHSTEKISSRKAISSGIYKTTRNLIFFNKLKVLRKCFLVLIRGLFQQLRCSQFNTYTVKPMSLCFLKESKGEFKIWMQIYADECVSLTCFYSLSNVFPILGKKYLKVFY